MADTRPPTPSIPPSPIKFPGPLSNKSGQLVFFGSLPLSFYCLLLICKVINGKTFWKLINGFILS